MKTTDPLTRLERWCVAHLSAGSPPSLVRRFAQARVARSPRARAAYDALLAAERVASGQEFGRAQGAQIEAFLFAALPAETATNKATTNKSLPNKTSLGSNARVASLLAGGGLAVSAVVLLVLSPVFEKPSAGDDERHGSVADLQARAAGKGTLGITVRCLDRRTTVATGRVAAGPGQPARTLYCPDDGLLGFAFTNTTSKPMHALVVGLNSEDELRWYAPFTAAGTSLPVPAGAVDQMLSTVADLRPMALQERVVLRAIFSDQPLHADSVAEIIRQARQRGLSPSRVDRLPLFATQQARVEVKIVQREQRALGDGSQKP